MISAFGIFIISFSIVAGVYPDGDYDDRPAFEGFWEDPVGNSLCVAAGVVLALTGVLIAFWFLMGCDCRWCV